ncbi:MAG: hypothetical protein ACXVAY_18750 [Mucilaginibacter sp.]
MANHVKIEDEDALAVLFWQQQTPTERIKEVARLRVNYYTWLNRFNPDEIEKAVAFRKL